MSFILSRHRLFFARYLGGVISCLSLMAIAVGALAVEVDNLKSSIARSVETSPEVRAEWYEFLSVEQAQRSARGGYYPSLDLEMQYGRETSETPTSAENTYNPDNSSLVMTQMLFDGFATKNEVNRQGYLKLASYYGFRQASESIALEVVQAYTDLLRYRQLTNLAKENFLQHQLINRDIEDRVTSGLGRRVDQEQSAGRLALAESNLLTEMTNLHDVTVRFHRLVGAYPASYLEPLAIKDGFVPEDRLVALQQAFNHSPEILAAVERVRASRSELKGKNAPMLPRFDLRLRQQLDHDTDGIEGRYDERAVELVMTYNLYRGGSDSASKRESYHRLDQARQVKEQACRNVRQTLAIAYNDVAAQMEQVGYLTRNREAIGRAREAYRKQFDIGQRTLLDLLDSENEFFEVRRSLVNAEYDVLIAQVRTLSAMGLLLQALDIGSASDTAVERLEFERDDSDSDWSSRCSLEVPELKAVDKPGLLSEIYSDARFRKDGGKIAFELDVKFSYKSTTISDGHQQDIADAADFLRRYPTVKGVIEGHTDSVASESYNRRLSLKRAEAVKRYLIEKYQISPARLKAVGRGEVNPIADNASEEGRRKNRRVELVMESLVSTVKPRLSDFNHISDADRPLGEPRIHPGWTY